MLRRHGYAACGLVALLGLAGCTGGGDDPPASSSTTSGASTASSPSTSSTTTTATTSGPADAYPAAARAHTVEGGKAFVEYYFASLNTAYTAPDATRLAGLAAKDCKFCARNQDTAAELVRKKQRYSEDPVSLGSMSPLAGAPKGEEYFGATLKQRGAAVIDAAGGIVRRDKVVSGDINIVVRWTDDRWTMVGAEHT